MTKPATAWEVNLAFHEYSASNQEIKGVETGAEAIDAAIAKTDEEEAWKRGSSEGNPFACELHRRNHDGTLSRMPVPFLKSERAILLSRDSDGESFKLETVEGATRLRTPGRHCDARPITFEVRDTDDGLVLSDAGETLTDTDETQRATIKATLNNETAWLHGSAVETLANEDMVGAAVGLIQVITRIENTMVGAGSQPISDRKEEGRPPI